MARALVRIPTKTMTTTVFLSGSGTYITPANCKMLIIKAVGGGGGGQGSSSTGWGNPGLTGVATSFGSGSLIVASAGNGGNINSPLGGGYIVNTPAVPLARVQGGQGNAGQGKLANQDFAAGIGGSSFFGGGGAGLIGGATGGTGAPNTGGGGGGAGMSITLAGNMGSGGSAGGYVEAMIINPNATYPYVVGTGGAGGAAGTNGFAGGAGGTGILIIEEYY